MTNNEIKEKIPFNVRDVLEDINSNILWNYITNLQQEINKLTTESTEWESKCYNLQEAKDSLQNDYQEAVDKITNLQQENESLRTRIKTIKRLRKKQTQKKNKYKSIIFDEEQKLKDYKSRLEKSN